MTKGDWLILARTNPLLKPIPRFLKSQGLFFETSQGNSIGKTLFEDVGYWNQMRKGEKVPEIQKQRVLERMSKRDNTLEWYDAFDQVVSSTKDYLRSMLANGEDLSKKPRIKVSTIHGAKGGEATNVVLFLNQTINTMKAAKKSVTKQDEEYRVWYVAVTRTMKNLYLIKCNNRQKEFKI
jgi:superfamily I DNA/RNA helicase